MKGKKKPKGTKARVQAYKKRSAYIAAAIAVAVLVIIIAVSSFFVYSFLDSSPNQTNNPTYQFKAAIVDHLSLSAPNQTFIQSATNILKQAGYTVNYYPGEEVTVEFYRNLPTHGYGLVILRVHSAGDGWLFTSEPYSTSKYVHEQLTDRIGLVTYSLEDAERGIGYLGMGPMFVKSSMNRRFENTTVIMMGCNGLTYTSMAEAFIEKGAKVYISWSGSVLASHTDTATIHLLQHLITEKQAIKQAVTETMKEVGPDPEYKSPLIYYPLEAGEQTIENITGES